MTRKTTKIFWDKSQKSITKRGTDTKEFPKCLLKFHMQVFLSIHTFEHTWLHALLLITYVILTTLHICVLIGFNEYLTLYIFYTYIFGQKWPFVLCLTFGPLLFFSLQFFYITLCIRSKKNNKQIQMRQEPSSLIQSVIISSNTNHTICYTVS